MNKRFSKYSEQNVHRNQLSALFTRISCLMTRSQDEASFMHHALADIGQTLQVSRAFTFTLTGTVWSNNYEWVAPGISSEINNLQHLDMSEMQEDSMLPQLAKGKTFFVKDIRQIEDPVLHEVLAGQGIAALVSFPLFYKGAVVGFFGMDQCGQVPDWTDETSKAVVTLGSFMNAAHAYFFGKQQLQKKRAQLHGLFDSLPMPIYVSSPKDYSVLFCNKVIHDNFDTSNLEQKKCYSTFQQLEEPCPFCTNEFLSNDAPPYVWHHHNSALNMDFKIVDSLVTWEENKDMRFSIALDITESLRAERENVLEREANVAKGLFIANMSHELRTPLNGIIGLTHLADQANTDATVQNYLQKIKFSSDNLLGVINETLDLTEIEEGKISLELRPFHMEDILSGVKAILQAEVDRKELYLDIVLDPDLPKTLMGDSLRISQVLLNFTSNAVKFTSEGGVTLSCHKAEIPQGKEENSSVHWLRLSVTDTGIGISEEQSKRLFKEFSQVDSSTSRQYGGTGLGLTISQNFMELMGGHITVQSTVGKGSTFTCIFPLTACDTYDDAPLQEEIVQEHDITGTRILLVEDNEINALIACEVLESYGCIVHTAENGSEALTALEKASYDIVLMDIQMPVMDGLEATRRIRANTKFDTLPIVAMSAHAMVQDYEKSREAGMQDHVAKPFAPEALRVLIYEMVSQDFCFVP